MSFVKLLVPVGGDVGDVPALGAAFAAAKRFSAHVAALFIHSDPRESVPLGELPMPPDFVQGMVDAATGLDLAAAKKARETIETLAAAAGIPVTAAARAGGGPAVSFAAVAGHPPATLAHAARLCDVVVFPPLLERNTTLFDGFTRVLARGTAPVLVAAAEARETLGRAVAVGWDDGIACGRALIAALPFLAAAEKIVLIAVHDGGEGAPGLAEAQNYLALHGLSAETRVVKRGGAKVAPLLCDAALAAGCDLLVAGGYGRGRLAEAMFGGVTDALIASARLPLFLVH
jgi:nucleotide-binding universal stress UspA family protein